MRNTYKIIKLESSYISLKLMNVSPYIFFFIVFKSDFHISSIFIANTPYFFSYSRE